MDFKNCIVLLLAFESTKKAAIAQKSEAIAS